MFCMCLLFNHSLLIFIYICERQRKIVSTLISWLSLQSPAMDLLAEAKARSKQPIQPPTGMAATQVLESLPLPPGAALTGSWTSGLQLGSTLRHYDGDRGILTTKLNAYSLPRSF